MGSTAPDDRDRRPHEDRHTFRVALGVALPGAVRRERVRRRRSTEDGRHVVALRLLEHHHVGPELVESGRPPRPLVEHVPVGLGAEQVVRHDPHPVRRRRRLQSLRRRGRHAGSDDHREPCPDRRPHTPPSRHRRSPFVRGAPAAPQRRLNRRCGAVSPRDRSAPRSRRSPPDRSTCTTPAGSAAARDSGSVLVSCRCSSDPATSLPMPAPASIVASSHWMSDAPV